MKVQTDQELAAAAAAALKLKFELSDAIEARRLEQYEGDPDNN